jgi:hypothetical protein
MKSTLKMKCERRIGFSASLLYLVPIMSIFHMML